VQYKKQFSLNTWFCPLCSKKNFIHN